MGDGAALLGSLPPHVRERVRVAKRGPTASGGFVLCWLRSSLRAHEHPALDAAVGAANALALPLLVLLHVERDYPRATARRQAFLLEGARGAQRDLARRGLRAHALVERRGVPPGACLALAGRAALVVAEEPFSIPWLEGARRMSQAAAGPLWLADCASVAPCALVPPGACHRAFAFEQAARRLHDERVGRPWQEAALAEGMPGELPAGALEGLPDSVDLQAADLSLLVQEAEVDMSVPPVGHTTGGSDAGYARWDKFVAGGGLRTYAKRRNESLDVHGVSRMSAYLNLGMVSPMRIAREASIASGAGKSKFLHEFLTWRGVAYAHCYHFPMPASGPTLAQLPTWAQESLQKHAHERREGAALQDLRAARSGDRAWDGMQRYLAETGELHNNARMGWGKAVARWAASPEEAVAALVDLNDRFALDGHAPPSYAGLLGCLGLFEGPKAESAVMGKVSYRPPKPKYAALPGHAHELFACSPAAASSPRQRGPASGSSVGGSTGTAAPARQVGIAAALAGAAARQRQALPQGAAQPPEKAAPEWALPDRKRRWKAKALKGSDAACIDLTDEGGSGVMGG